MSDVSNAMKRLMTPTKNARTVSNRKKVRIVSSIPAAEIGPLLRRLTRDLGTYSKGYILSFLLQERLAADHELFHELTNELVRRVGPFDFRVALTDILRVHSRKAKRRRDAYQAALARIAGDKRQSLAMRAHAARRAGLRPSAEGKDLVDAFLRSRSNTLVNAAGHVMAAWKSDRRRVPRKSSARIVRYATENPRVALRSAGILSAIAALGAGRDTRVVNRLMRSARRADDLAPFINIVGPTCTTETVAKVVAQVADKRARRAKVMLRSLFSANPEQLDALYKKGYKAEFIWTLGEMPSIVDGRHAKWLSKSISDSDPELRRDTRRVARAVAGRWDLMGLQAASAQMIDGSVHGELRLKLEAQLEIVAEIALTLPRVVEDVTSVDEEGCTVYHKADCIARDLGEIQNMPLVDNHWHNHLYAGLEVDRDDGEISLSAIQNDGDEMQRMVAEGDVSDPDASIRDVVRELKGELVEQMEWGGDKGYALHGGRRPGGMTPERANEIVSTADSLFGEEIGYVWMDMLSSKGETWQGNVDDIAALRCDGVVEFCYEKNDEEVCRGRRPHLWNIARNGNKYRDNHNKLHGIWHWDSPRGEICPRIQAGNRTGSHKATEINLTKLSRDGDPTPPVIALFGVTPRIVSIPPMIHFRIESDRYSQVWVRLTVRRGSSGPFHFVTTSTLGADESLDEDWDFVCVGVERDHRHLWLGETEDGQDYQSETGPFEFRLVAIDLGGNVSELKLLTVEPWPQ